MYKIERKYLYVESKYGFDKDSFNTYRPMLEETMNELENNLFEIVSYELVSFIHVPESALLLYPHLYSDRKNPYVMITVDFLLRKKDVKTRTISYDEFEKLLSKQSEIFSGKIKNLEDTVQMLTDSINEKQKSKKL